MSSLTLRRLSRFGGWRMRTGRPVSEGSEFSQTPGGVLSVFRPATAIIDLKHTNTSLTLDLVPTPHTKAKSLPCVGN